MISCIGTIFYSISTKRVLFVLRNNEFKASTWAYVGGKIEPNESPLSALTREIKEEIGSNVPPIIKHIPIDQYTSSNYDFVYHTFVSIVKDEFVPRLNDEHKGYAWTTLDGIPKPIHPSAHGTLNIEEIKMKLRTIMELYS